MLWATFLVRLVYLLSDRNECCVYDRYYSIAKYNFVCSRQVQQAHSTEFNKLRRHTIKNGKHSKNMPQIVNRTEFTEIAVINFFYIYFHP